MKILAMRTDKPEAEVYLYDGEKQMGKKIWLAHRELSDTLLLKIFAMLKKSCLTIQDLDGILVFRGPGSFTGLRIGITVANSLAYALNIPVAGSLGDDWLKAGIKKINSGEDDKIVLPEYGAEPNITKQKK